MKKDKVFLLAMLAVMLVFGLVTMGCGSAKFATDDLVYKDVVKGDYVEVLFSDKSDKEWTQKVSLVSIDGHRVPAKFPGSANIAIPETGPLNLKVHLTVKKAAMKVDASSTGAIVGSLFNAAKKAVVDAAKGRKEVNADFDLVIPRLPNKSKVTVEYWEADIVGAASASGLKELAGGEGDALSNQFLLVSIPAKKDDLPPAPTAVRIQINLAGQSMWGLQAIRL